MSLWRRFLNHIVPHHTNAYRPHLLRRGWMVFFLALVLATEGFLVASLVARQSGGSFLASVIAGELVALTNTERSNQSLGLLADNPLLDLAAQAKADDMAAKGYFAHVSPDGTQPWDFISAAGYDYKYAGENLAVRFIDSKDVVTAWMASPTHRANIVKPAYREIGIGLAEGMYKGAHATYVVQYFGAPMGRVLGAEVSAAPSNTFNAFVRQLPKLVSDPRATSAWIFGGIASLLVVLIALAFFFHIQVQGMHIILPGAVVAGIAAFFIVFNGSLLSISGNQAAGVGLSGGPEVVLTLAATSTER